MIVFWIWLIGLGLTSLGLGLFVDPDDIPMWGEIRLAVFWPIYLCLIIGAIAAGFALWLARITKAVSRRLTPKVKD